MVLTKVPLTAAICFHKKPQMSSDQNVLTERGLIMVLTKTDTRKPPHTQPDSLKC